jgi:hypothetical protein
MAEAVKPGWNTEYLKYLGKRAAVSTQNMIGTQVNGRQDDIPVVGPAVVNTYALGKLVSQVIPKKYMPYELSVPVLDKALKGQDQREQIRADQMGIRRDAQNALEVGIDILPNLVGPSGGAKAGKKVASNFLKDTGKFLAESTLPLAQGGLKTRAAVAGVGMGLSEGIELAVPDEGYQGVLEKKTAPYKRMNGQLPKATVGDELSFLDNPTDELSFLDQPSTTASKTKANDELSFLDENTPTSDGFEVGPADSDWTIGNTITAGALGIGTLALGLISGGTIRSTVRARVAAAKKGLVGTTEIKQATPAVTDLQSNFIQANQAAITAPKKETQVPKAVADDIERKIELNAPSIINSSFIHAGTTGQMPRSAVNIGPILPTLETAIKTLTPVEMEILAQGGLAKTGLDQIALASRGKAVPVQPLFNDYTPAELKQMSDVLDQTPNAKAVHDQMLQTNRKLADYLEEQGMITAAEKQTWLVDKPNYMHLSRSEALVGDSSFLGIKSDRAGSGLDPSFLERRMLDTATGVQKVADPLVDMPRYIREVIKSTQHNALRKDILQAMDGGSVYGVKKVAKAGEDTISIRNNGVEEHYSVPDKSLNTALKFNPTIAESTFHVTGRALNKVFISSVVGKKLNPLFPLTSAIYDNLTMRVTLSKGMHLGVINDQLAKVGLSLGRLDPTSGATAIIPVGSFRYLWDSGAQKLGESFADSIVNSDNILAKLFPDAVSRKHLADLFSNYYINSVKAQGTRDGVFGKHVYDNADVQQPMNGLEDSLPELSVYGAESALAYAPGLVQKTLAASHLANVRTNANVMVRLLSTLQEAVRESNTYMAYSANKPNFSNSLELASNVRRMGGDMAQRGMGDFGQAVEAYIPFANAAIQPVAAAARIVENGGAKGVGRLTANLASLLIPSIVLQYTAAMLDPEVEQKMRDATPAQLTNRLYLPMGIVLPSEQLIRPIWGATIQLLNEISGLNDGQLDPNFLTAIQRMSDFGIDEETQEAISMAAKAGLASANPISPANAPIINAGATLMGVDLDLTMSSGRTVTIRENVGAEDAIVSRQTEKLINALSAGSISAYVSSVIDFANAMDKGVDMDKAAQVALSRITDKTANTNGPIENLMFKNYEKVISAFDPQTSLLMDKKNALTEINDVYAAEIRAPGATGVDPRTSRMLPTDPSWIAPEYRNTMLNPIGLITKELTSEIRDAQSELNKIVERDQSLQNRDKHFSSTIEERNKARNVTIERRRELTDVILFAMREAEEKIQAATGDPTFTYQNFDKNKYAKMPYPPSPAPMPGLELPPMQ